MGLYANAEYRVGFQGYLKYKTQAGLLVPTTQVVDPSIQPGVDTVVGPCQLPAWNINDNFSPVEGIGSAKDVGQHPGRRECDIRTQLFVANGELLEWAVRDHTTTPVDVSTVKGLKLLCLEIGTDADYGDEYAKQALDALFSSLRVECAENQKVTADMEWWAVGMIDATPDTSVGVPESDVLIWQYITWDINGTDYKPILSRVTVSVNNTLERVGSRNQLGATGSEEEISRTPYGIRPKMEKLQVQYGLHDKLPDALLTGADWGTVTLHAEQPGAGAGRKRLDIEIDANYLNRRGQGQVGANNMLTFTADTASHGITIDGSATT